MSTKMNSNKQMIDKVLEFIRKNPEESMQDEHLIDFYHRVIVTEEESSEEEEEEEEEHECELCKKHVQETEYLPSKEDEEKQQILGNDYCLECYKKVEKFEFVENIDLDK